MTQFLAVGATSHVVELERQLGSAEKIKNALEEISKASLASNSAVEQMALRSSGDSGVGSSLLKLRDQVKVLARAVETTANDIQDANMRMDIAGQLITIADMPLDPNTWFEFILFDIEEDTVVNRYQNGIRGIHMDMSNAIRALDVYAQTKELQPLIESHSEAYTRFYYELTNRNKSDVEAIERAYGSVRTNISNIVRGSGNEVEAEKSSVEEALASMFLAKNDNSIPCSTQYVPVIATVLFPTQGEVLSCLSRERLRMARLGETVDNVIALMQANNVDFVADITSCARFGATPLNSLAINQTKGCLEANVAELNHYGTLLSAELDQLHPLIQLEANASVFRANLCIKQSHSESTTQLREIRENINKCAVTGV